MWSCWIELLQYLDLETAWLNTLEERVQMTENLSDKLDVVNDALEVLSICCTGDFSDRHI